MTISNDAKTIIDEWLSLRDRITQTQRDLYAMNQQLIELVERRDKVEMKIAEALSVNKVKTSETVALGDGRLLEVTHYGSVHPDVHLFTPRSYNASATK